MEENQIVRSGDEKWKLLDRIKKDAAEASNNLMYLLADHLEKYGAARGDILDYLAEHPLKSVNSRALIDEVKELLQRNLSVQWMDIIQNILENQEERAVLYFGEMKRAALAEIPYEVYLELLNAEKTPYEIHLFLDEKVNGFMGSMESRERNRMLLLDGLADGLERCRTEMDALLARMEDCLERQEKIMLQSNVSPKEAIQSQDISKEGVSASEESEIRMQEEPEDMFFEESWLPKMEFEGEDATPDMEGETGNVTQAEAGLLEEDVSNGESLVPELEKMPEMPEGEDLIGDNLVPELEEMVEGDVSGEESLVPELDDIPEITAEDEIGGSFMLELDKEGNPSEASQGQNEESGEVFLTEKSAISAEDKIIRNEEEVPKRYKRLMAAATRMLAMEKRRFLNKDPDAQREFLIKRLLEKKAGASKVNAFKKLFGNFSNEYLYDLVIRDATEAELENLLVL